MHLREGLILKSVQQDSYKFIMEKNIPGDFFIIVMTEVLVAETKGCW